MGGTLAIDFYSDRKRSCRLAIWIGRGNSVFMRVSAVRRQDAIGNHRANPPAFWQFPKSAHIMPNSVGNQQTDLRTARP